MPDRVTADRDRPRILHVSGDFPDPIEPFKTRVIETLLSLTQSAFEHRVISINRTAPSRAETLSQLLSPGKLAVETQDFAQGVALAYQAPGQGLRHRTKLEQLGDWLIEAVKAMPQRPDLIVGHKLTIEGIAVHRAATALDLPYALCLQGGTDAKILTFRRDLHSTFRNALHGAQVIFPFAPWTWDCVIEALGEPAGRRIVLPCPTDLDMPTAPRVSGEGLISVFHLKSYRRKNLAGLVKAAKILESRQTRAPITVIGGGDDQGFKACNALIRERPSIQLAGAMDREQLRARMRSASGFVLPSLRESFGLVFIEALFAGLPVIYPQGTAISGYFDDAPFAIGVDARDPVALANAMGRVMEEEAAMKSALDRWQKSDAARQFQRDSIAHEFERGLKLAAGFATRG